MNRVRHRRLLALVLLLALGVAGGSSSMVSGQAVAPFRTYIPISLGLQIPRTVFGVEMTQATAARNLDGARAIGSRFVRRNGLLWKDIEPVEGAGYNWAAPSAVALETELRNISGLGLEPVLIVRGYPRWAAQSDCAPINPAKNPNFAAFLAAAVSRYSVPPYNVRYWELGNEPDAPITGDNLFGCWGNPADPTYFGGGAYGAMLKAVYPAMKAVNANIQVMNGSLLLDKPDPAPIAKFMRGVLASGAGGSFDVLGYHSYCFYINSSDPKLNNNPDGVDSRNQVCTGDWKVPFLRKLLAEARVPAKPMFNTETALLCSGGLDCRQAQADYVGRNFARVLRDGLAGNIWYIYDSDSFRNTSIVDPANPFVSRPLYAAFKQASLMLGETQYVGVLGGQSPGVEGHRFTRGGETITIVWSNAPGSAKIPVAAGTTPSCFARDGQTLACAAVGGVVTLPVGRSPLYVVAR